jgi:hypothetical protein
VQYRLLHRILTHTDLTEINIANFCFSWLAIMTLNNTNVKLTWKEERSVWRSVLIRRSQWPCGIRRGHKPAWLLGFRLRNPMTAWMFVCCARVCVCVCVCLCLCFVLVAASATSWSLVQSSPIGRECLIVCDLDTSTKRWPKPELGCRATGGKEVYY